MTEADAFYEEQVFPLTTNTNCYTAYTSNCRWATERHVVYWKNDQVQWKELPIGRLCVGYTSVSPWEAIALLPDDWQSQQQPEDEAAPRPTEATSTTPMEPTTNNDDGIPSRSHSLVGPVHIPTDDTDFSSNNNSMPELSLESVLEPRENGSTNHTAEILVRRIDHSEEFTIPIPYRPVALHMMLSNDDVSPRILMGSADHNKLHSYEVRSNNDTNRDFYLRHDQEFPASVLRMTSDASNNRQTLIAACQDGSIVTLEYGTDGTLTKLFTVIIDGPILALSYRDDVVTIGSLCGYVAQMKDGVLSMVVEGLATHSNQEDAVLAVESTTVDRIWVGTRSGRCLLYGHENGSWALIWSVVLPYAIHGILHDSRRDRIVVTTTRGVHIFRSIVNAVDEARARLTKLQQHKK